MCLNRICEGKVMTIWIARELPLFNFERFDIICNRIGHPCEKLWRAKLLESFRCSISSVSTYYAPEKDLRVNIYHHLNLSRASVVQFHASRYVMRLNRTFEWKVMTIWISRELSLFNFECLDILWASIIYSTQTLCPFEFVESFPIQFWGSRYMIHMNWTSKRKVMAIWISGELLLFNF